MMLIYSCATSILDGEAGLLQDNMLSEEGDSSNFLASTDLTCLKKSYRLLNLLHVGVTNLQLKVPLKAAANAGCLLWVVCNTGPWPSLS